MNYTPSSCLSLSALLTGSAAKLHMLGSQPPKAKKEQKKRVVPSDSKVIRSCSSKTEFLTAEYILGTMRAKGVERTMDRSRVVCLLHIMVGKGFYETDPEAKFGHARFRLIR